jgi:very-short-patch-repair endonuclease
LRAEQPRPEAKLWQALRDRMLAGWKFRRQRPVDRFVADFACPDAKLIVEVDGATQTTDREIARDAERTRILEACSCC